MTAAGYDSLATRVAEEFANFASAAAHSMTHSSKPSETLTEGDFAGLERSWIDRDFASRAQLYRVDRLEGAEIVGRSRQRGDYSGIVFPYIWPGENRTRSNRLRRDHPDIEHNNGRPRERNKYMAAPGEGNRLYFMPGTPAELLQATDIPIVLTEGEKKTISLARLAEHGGQSPRFLAAGISGVWNWRGVNGKTSGPNGERRDTKGTISDLSRVVFGGRTVHILFDANVDTNTSVAAARNQLARELISRKAHVCLVDLPASDGVNGNDDYLAKYGPEAALKLLDGARPFDPKELLSKLFHTDFGNEQAFEFLFGDEFIYDWTAKQWLLWNGVHWKPDKVNTIDRRMLDVARQRLDATALIPATAADASGKPLKEKAVAAALRLQNIRFRQSAIGSATSNPRFARRAEDFDRDDYLFACANGIIELKTGTLRPGRREDLITLASPVEFDPTATCPRWLRFLTEVFGNDDEMLAFVQAAVGYSLLGLTREEIFFILYGKGRNGKGTFLRVLLELLGDYGKNIDVSALIADKSANARAPRNDVAAIVGCRFVTCQESREGAKLDEALIKALTGGDLITARFLYKECFTFRPTWKIWMATRACSH